MSPSPADLRVAIIQPCPRRGDNRASTAQVRRADSVPLNLRTVTYFQAVRIYSAVEMCVLTSLIVAWIAGLDQAQLVLGWTHGFGWILLCLGVVQYFAAFAIWRGASWGRWFGVACASARVSHRTHLSRRSHTTQHATAPASQSGLRHATYDDRSKRRGTAASRRESLLRGLVSAAPECFLPGPAEPHGGGLRI